MLVPLTVDAIPDNLLPYTNLSNLLSKEDWDKLCRTTARAADYRLTPEGKVPRQTNSLSGF